ncbi:hypothetical protein [Curtobacterium flaccumfaciens]|uniref:hypothetical protein n=1 Tax=Curtobacterium flaccumfaciens TaxID=2035 RepID=UPI00136750BD|nr:hypothetical protein [Curtobacterium flaccumfaciens]QHN62449.1 hypothetical protein GBG65_19365 [Curtobacterium flaccumfaciens pv. flaccumfaciens]
MLPHTDPKSVLVDNVVPLAKEVVPLAKEGADTLTGSASATHVGREWFRTLTREALLTRGGQSFLPMRAP